MNNKTKLVCIAATATGAIALVVLSRGAKTEHAKEVPRAAAQPAVRAASKQAHPLHFGAPTGLKPQLGTLLEPSEEDLADPRFSEVTPELRGMLRALEDRYEGETADAAWAERAKSTLEKNIASVLPTGSHLEEAECRATLCRAVIAHDDEEAHVLLVQDHFPALWTGPKTVYRGRSEQGDSATVVLTQRTSFELPTKDDSDTET